MDAMRALVAAESRIRAAANSPGQIGSAARQHVVASDSIQFAALHGISAYQAAGGIEGIAHLQASASQTSTDALAVSEPMTLDAVTTWGHEQHTRRITAERRLRSGREALMAESARVKALRDQTNAHAVEVSDRELLCAGVLQEAQGTLLLAVQKDESAAEQQASVASREASLRIRETAVAEWNAEARLQRQRLKVEEAQELEQAAASMRKCCICFENFPAAAGIECRATGTVCATNQLHDRTF